MRKVVVKRRCQEQTCGGLTLRKERFAVCERDAEGGEFEVYEILRFTEIWHPTGKEQNSSINVKDFKELLRRSGR